MKKIKALLFLVCLCAFCLINVCVFAGEKKAEEEIIPVWVNLGSEVLPSDHNPNGMEVLYSFDIASSKIHSSNKDFGFWVARQTKAKNEVDLTYTRISKDQTSYCETQKLVFFLDGTFKDAKILDKNIKYPLTEDVVFRNVPEMMKNKNSIGNYSVMPMPEFPVNANKLIIKHGKPGFENWLCFLDDRSTGLDSKDSKKLTLITYAYNVADRIYYKGVTYCERTGPTTYIKKGGSSHVYTFEDKLLYENMSKPGCCITDKAADSTVSFYYMFYRTNK